MLTHGELFAGIGGGSLAASQAGIETLWAVEIDPAAQRVIRQHNPGMAIYDDVRAVGRHNLEPVDIITFGSPCQGLSVAGRREGLRDERSGLYFEAIRIIAELRPAFALWENVPGALSSAGGRDFGAALDALANIGALDIAWRILDAQYFNLAQRRRRVFVVADFRGERAGQILFEPESLCGHPAPRREAREDFTHSLAPSLTNSGRGVERAGESRGQDPVVACSVLLHAPRYDGESETFVTGTLRSNGGAHSGFQLGDGLVTHTLTAEGHDAPKGGTGRGTPLVFNWQNGGNEGYAFSSSVSGPLDVSQTKAVALRGRDGGSMPELSDVPSALRASQGGGDKAHVLAFAENQRAEVLTSDVVRSITNGGGKPGQGYPAVHHGMVVRRLTPLECSRLQGYPDTYLDLDPPLLDSAKYCMLGNAFAVPVVAWILKRLVAVATQREDVPR